MTNNYREGQSDVKELSKIVQKSIDDHLDVVADSKENGVLALGKKGSDVVWCYKYFKENSQEDVQRSWFKWTLPDKLVHHFMDQSTYYAVVQKDDQLFLVSSQVFDTEDDIDYLNRTYETATYLDYWAGYEQSSILVGDNPNNISVEYPGPLLEDKELYLVTSDGQVLTETDRTGNVITFNYRYGDRITAQVGYTYPFRVTFPTIYITKEQSKRTISDTRSSLILHRVKLNFAAVGMYEFRVRRFGGDNYVTTFEVPTPDAYELDANPVVTEYEATIPIYYRNKNTELRLSSVHPTPTILTSMRWEGDYTSNFYSRV